MPRGLCSPPTYDWEALVEIVFAMVFLIQKIVFCSACGVFGFTLAEAFGVPARVWATFITAAVLFLAQELTLVMSSAVGRGV